MGSTGVQRGRAGGISRRVVLVMTACALLIAGVASTRLATEAVGADVRRCEQFAQQAAQRRVESPVLGAGGAQVVVVGDSWSAGLGLRDPAAAWTSRLGAPVHVDAFSGSGFTPAASPCADAWFGDRVGRAVAGGAELIVLEGGLNDTDQPVAALRTGFATVMTRLHGARADGARVIVVGPAAAPARASGARWVDAELAVLAGQHGTAYVSTLDLDLPYLDDGLHLTPDGHRAFGDAVASRIAAIRG